MIFTVLAYAMNRDLGQDVADHVRVLTGCAAGAAAHFKLVHRDNPEKEADGYRYCFLFECRDKKEATFVAAAVRVLCPEHGAYEEVKRPLRAALLAREPLVFEAPKFPVTGPLPKSVDSIRKGDALPRGLTATGKDTGDTYGGESPTHLATSGEHVEMHEIGAWLDRMLIPKDT